MSEIGREKSGDARVAGRDDLDFEEEMVRFMQWFWRARQSLDDVTSVAFYVFAPEALLESNDQHERIAALLAERVAFLMPSGGGVVRANLAKKVKQLYATRSKLAHGQDMMQWFERVKYSGGVRRTAHT